MTTGIREEVDSQTHATGGSTDTSARSGESLSATLEQLLELLRGELTDGERGPRAEKAADGCLDAPGTTTQLSRADAQSCSEDDLGIELCLAAQHPAQPSGNEFRRRLRAFADECRRFGWASAAKSVAYRVARRSCQFRIVHVLSLDLAPVPTSTPPSAEGIEYRWLMADDIRAYAVDPETDLDISMADSLQNGDRFCFGAFRGSELVNYAWYALDSIEAEHSFGAGITYPANTLYLYKAYTHPRYRGRQVHQSAVDRAARFFAARGIVRFVILVECANWASLRSHGKLGFRQVGKILNVNRPPLQFERLPRLVETLGLRFADQP